MDEFKLLLSVFEPGGLYTLTSQWGTLPGLPWMPCYSARCKPKHHQIKHPPDSRIVSHYPLLMWLRLSEDLTDLVNLTWHSIHLIPEDLRVCKPEKLNVRRVLQSHPKLRAKLAEKLLFVAVTYNPRPRQPKKSRWNYTSVLNSYKSSRQQSQEIDNFNR